MAPRRNPGQGKKIDTFYFDVDEVGEDDAGREERTHRKVEIDVFMKKRYAGDGDQKPPLATIGVIFEVVCSDANLKMEGSDLDAVLAAMRGKLDTHYKIRWANWLIVTVESVRQFDGEGAGLNLTWKRVERGETMDGKVLMRRYNSHRTFSSRWTIEPWPEVVKDDGRVVACIEATETNLEALQKFKENIDQMRKVLASFVTPDRIAETLATIAGGNALLAIPSGRGSKD